MSFLPRLQRITTNASSHGITALAVVVTGWLLFAWALADMNTPQPNGAPPNRSEAQLAVLFMGFVAMVLAGIGAALAAHGLRRNRGDRAALLALVLGMLTIVTEVLAFQLWMRAL